MKLDMLDFLEKSFDRTALLTLTQKGLPIARERISPQEYAGEIGGDRFGWADSFGEFCLGGLMKYSLENHWSFFLVAIFFSLSLVVLYEPWFWEHPLSKDASRFFLTSGACAFLWMFLYIRFAFANEALKVDEGNLVVTTYFFPTRIPLDYVDHFEIRNWYVRGMKLELVEISAVNYRQKLYPKGIDGGLEGVRQYLLGLGLTEVDNREDWSWNIVRAHPPLAEQIGVKPERIVMETPFLMDLNVYGGDGDDLFKVLDEKFN